MSNVRYSYHVDPVRPGRVVTIARQLEGNDVLFGFAVCKPTYWIIPDAPRKNDTYASMYKVEGDRFTKKQGRLLATGRLTKRPYRVTRKEVSGSEDEVTLEGPMDAIRRYFYDGGVQMKDSEGNEIPCPDFIVRTVVYNPWQVRTPTPVILFEDGTEVNLGEMFASLVGGLSPEDQVAEEGLEQTGT